MFTGGLHPLPAPSAVSSLHRRFNPSPIFPPPRLHDRHPSSLFVVSSSKKLRGRRRPAPRLDRSAPTTTDDEEEEEEETNVVGEVDIDTPPFSTLVVSQKAEETPVRGLDVLKALQNASSSSSAKKRRGGRPRYDVMGASKDEYVDSGSEAKSPEIKEDWWSRLEALEKEILELYEEQHGS